MERRWYDDFSYTWRDPFTQVTDVDRKHNLTFAGIWDMPFGKGRAMLNDMPKIGEMLIGGWTSNANFIYQSGIPQGTWRDYEFLCGDPTAVERTENRWFFNDVTRQRDCWRNLRPYEYRVMGNRFDGIRHPAKPQIDLMVSKKINVTERYQLELRGEAFNAFNTPIRREAPSGNPLSADFGILPVAQYNFPRNIQIGMRLRF
jgi:hypothetical protein